MKTLEKLGISPAPWELMDDGTTVVCHIDREDDVYGEVAVCQGGKADQANARLIAAAPNPYEALRDAAEDRCYECPYKLSCETENCKVHKWLAILAEAGGEE